jgi:hypothetical protein
MTSDRKHPLKRLSALIAAPVAALLVLVTAAPPARAENGVSFFGGWRGSSSFEDTVADRTVRLRDGAAASVALDLHYDANRQLQLFASRQSTSLQVTPIGTTAAMKLPIDVHYLHFGGTNFFDGPAGQGPYVAGGIGATVMSPGLDGFASETRPSLSVALGYMAPIVGALALRVEGRLYYTLINSSSSLFCSGGCTIAVKGDALQQTEVLVGVSLRF